MTVETSLKGLIEKIEVWDHKVLLSFYKSKFSKKWLKFAKVYSFFGNYIFWGAIWIVMGLHAYFFTKDYYLFVLFTAGFDQSVIIYLIIRYKIVNRDRPFITLGKEGIKQHDELIAESKSFPSGHVTFFLFFGFIFAFYFHSWLILLIFLILDIGMAITRLILGVHFPTDVMFGFIFGTLFALLYLGFTHVYLTSFFFWMGNLASNLLPF